MASSEYCFQFTVMSIGNSFQFFQVTNTCYNVLRHIAIIWSAFEPYKTTIAALHLFQLFIRAVQFLLMLIMSNNKAIFFFCSASLFACNTQGVSSSNTAFSSSFFCRLLNKAAVSFVFHFSNTCLMRGDELAINDANELA